MDENLEGGMVVKISADGRSMDEVIDLINKIRKEYKGNYTLSFEITY